MIRRAPPRKQNRKKSLAVLHSKDLLKKEPVSRKTFWPTDTTSSDKFNKLSKQSK